MKKKNPWFSLPPLVEVIPAILIAVFFVGGCILAFAPPTEEVETYTVGCEISQMAYAEETISRFDSRPVYRVGVRNDDFATTFEISSEQFAKYSIGEIVEVEVTTWEEFDGNQYQTYRIVD